MNTEANLIAHAVLGAIEAQVTGNNAAAGAVGALTAEAAAPYIMQVLYGTDKAADLNDSQKQNIANLSQIAAGLSGGLVGDSTASGIAGAEIGKRAVEDNFLKSAMENPEQVANLALLAEGNQWKKEVEDKAKEEAIEESIDIADKYAPHYVSVSGEFYAIGAKAVLNLRNVDTFLGGSFYPLVVPNRGVGASMNLGWVVNLEQADIKNTQGERITGNTLSNNVISGTGASVTGCYYVCIGYGQTISSNHKDKVYKTFEIGGGVGLKGNIPNASGNISEDKIIKIGE